MKYGLTYLAVGLAWLLHFLPTRALRAIGGGLGWALYLGAKERREVASTNVASCFPELSTQQRAQLVQRHFVSWGKAFLEQPVLWWGSARRIQRLVRLAGVEHLRAVAHRPVILLAPHFAGLDAGGIRVATERRVSSMYRKLKNPVIDRMVYASRMRFGPPELFSRQDGIRSVVKSLRHGLPFYYLPDQDYGPRDAVFVAFFGVAAATITGVSRLAKIADAKVVPCVTTQTRTGYVTRFYPAWENFPTDDVSADTRRMNAFIEDRVREMPEQYFWTHRRFKSRPAGEADFYAHVSAPAREGFGGAAD